MNENQPVSIMKMLSKKAAVVYRLGIVLIIFSMLDAITTYIALSTGNFEEANILGNAILEVSPVTFYTMGTVQYISIGILFIMVVQFRPSMYKFIMGIMITLAVLKMAPVVWNLLMMAGVI